MPAQQPPEAAEAQLAALEQMKLEPLRSEWRRLYKAAPPGRLSRELLIRSVAYKLQEVAHGGLSSGIQRQLSNMARNDPAGRAGEPAPASLRPGATLVRSWRGRTHTVLILAEGYEHDGQRYRSLSHIAKAITGAHWSGPRFFGLTATTKTAHEAA